jgi:hypothetical protein
MRPVTENSTNQQFDAASKRLGGTDGIPPLSPAGQGMLSDYGNSFHSLPGQNPVGQPLPGCPLDPAASRKCDQLLFPFARKRAGGRPKVAGAELRKIVIPIRYTEREHAVLKNEAARNHMSISTFVSILSLNKKLPPLVPAINLKAYERCGHSAQDIHELKRLVDQGVIPPNLRDKLEEIRAALAEIVAALVSLKPIPGEADE